MKQLLLGAASTATCLILLGGGVAYADRPVIHNVPGNMTLSAGANDTAVITFTPAIFVTDDDNDDNLNCSANNGATLTMSGQTLTGGTARSNSALPQSPVLPRMSPSIHRSR